MEQLDQVIAIIAITMGVGWASGINLYATLLALGLMANLGHVTLPGELQVLADPLVIAAAGLMYMVEFGADKIPGVDTGWDAIHTFIRIPAGALLAASAIGDMSPALQIAAALVGGSLAATSHATKAGGRVMINTSPEPMTNWAASIGEDVAVIFGLWAALQYPWLFLILLVLFIAMVIWLLPKIWAGVKGIVRRLRQLFGGGKAVEPVVDSPPALGPPE